MLNISDNSGSECLKGINKFATIAVLSCAMLSVTATAEAALQEVLNIPMDFTVNAPSGRYSVVFTANPALVASGEAQDIGTLVLTRMSEPNPGEYICFSSGTGANYITFTNTADEHITMVGDLWAESDYRTNHKVNIDDSATDKLSCEEWLSNTNKYIIGGIDSPKTGHFTGNLYINTYSS